jgi:hypothetical protein
MLPRFVIIPRYLCLHPGPIVHMVYCLYLVSVINPHPAAHQARTTKGFSFRCHVTAKGDLHTSDMNISNIRTMSGRRDKKQKQVAHK